MNISLTTDQYNALHQLTRWYLKSSHQFIDLCGPIYTGTWDLIQVFIEQIGLDPREVMYLGFDQKQVLELASKRIHAYYINGKLYKYIRNVDFDTIPILNPMSNHLEYKWTKSIRKKIDPRYRLIVVTDSILMSERMIYDLSSYGLPIILIRDPYLLPSGDSYIYTRDPNIELQEPAPSLIQNPIYFMAYSIINDQKLIPGTFGNTSIIKRKDLNLYNIKASSMNIAMSEDTRSAINHLYRTRVLKSNPAVTSPNERVYVASNHYGEIITNGNEKNIKVYLTQGITGTLTKVNKHAPITRYVGCDFQADFYFEPFVELYMDRNYLNGVTTPSRQIIPDETVLFEYAYALTPQKTRMNHWDDVTVIMESDDEMDVRLQKMMYYSAITRASKSLTLVI